MQTTENGMAVKCYVDGKGDVLKIIRMHTKYD